MKIIILFVIYIVNLCASVSIRGIDNRCLSVRSNGEGVQIFQCNGSPEQHWEVGIGNFKTFRVFSSKCLDVQGTNDGTPVVLTPCSVNIPSQIWDITPAGDITNRVANKCLDVRRSGAQNGAAVQIWSCAGTSNQKWRFVPDR